MKKDNLIYLGHIIDAIEEVFDFTKDGNEDHKTFRAVERSIEIIGEAARNLSKEFQEQYPEIPWSDIIGMRHKLAHDYFGVSAEIVWEVVGDDLPKLHKQVTNLLKKLS